MRVRFPRRYLRLTCTAVQSCSCVCLCNLSSCRCVISSLLLPLYSFESCSALSLQSRVPCGNLVVDHNALNSSAAANLGRVLIAAYADALAQWATWICLRGSSHFLQPLPATSHVMPLISCQKSSNPKMWNYWRSMRPCRHESNVS